MVRARMLRLWLCAACVVAAVPSTTAAAPGDLDPSFGQGGQLTLKVGTGLSGLAGANAVAVQPDGKLLVAGTAVTRRDTRFALVRLNADGRPDRGFGHAGTILTPMSDAADGAALVLQPDGRIVVAGNAGADRPTFALVRYEPDGRLDKSFGSGGRVTTRFPGGVSSAGALVRQADGKLVAAGVVYKGLGSIDDSFDLADLDGRLALTRYRADGSLDRAFGSNGHVSTAFDGVATANSLAIQPDGDVIAGGLLGNGIEGRFALARYREDGAIDGDFGSRGRSVLHIGRSSLDDGVIGMVVRPDGSIVAAGSTSLGFRAGSRVNSHFALLGLRANGRLNPSFGAHGVVTTSFGANTAVKAYALAEQADGKLIVAGSALVRQRRGPSLEPFAIARYNPSGSLDGRFGRRGRVLTNFPFPGQASANAVAIQPDGRIVVAGSVGGRFALARYFP